MNYKLLAAVIGGLFIGGSLGLALGVALFDDYIHNYTNTCVEAYNACLVELSACDPLYHYDLNITIGGFESD